MMRQMGFGVLFLFLGAVLFFCGALVSNSSTPSETDYLSSPLLANPPAPFSQATALKVVTFNIQDAMVISTDRPERMRAIAAKLTALDPDLVGIQESFIDRDREILLKGLNDSRLAHHRYYPSAKVGSGLLVLSAYPIAEAFFHRYTSGGKWYKMWHGDWWAGKGVSLARIDLGSGSYVDFYNTHAHARYGTDEYHEVQLSQMRELAAFINASRCKTVPAILVGDLNCEEGTEQFETLRKGAGLVRLMAMATRIDHVLGVADPLYEFETLSTEAIDEPFELGGREVRLSDHDGYISEIRITPVK